MAIQPLTITPLTPKAGSKTSFGATVSNIDLSHLTDDQWTTIHDALYKHHVLVFKHQGSLSPKAQVELTQRFDPASSSYGHGKTLDEKKSILHPDLKTVPHQPQVQVIGHGHYDAYEGLTDFTLKHPHHKTFHKTRISDEDDLDFTRFYRWHIDAALYELNPPKVTTLLAVQVPHGRRQTLRYDDGSGEEMDVSLGTTAFVSGETMYDLLSEEDKKFAREAKVEYAPHPYIWMSGARARSNGLGLESEARELTDAELPPIDKAKIKILPLCWVNPVTRRLALQVHPSAVRALHLPSGEKIEDLEKVREIVYRLQRPGIEHSLVYAHEWEEGDCVLFHNRGLIHSVVGAFGEGELRLFRQCNIAASVGVEGPDGGVY